LNIGAKKLTNSFFSSVARLAYSLMLLIFASSFVVQQANAYTDPGSGALIWQALMAGGVGLLFYIRKFIAKIRPQRKSESAQSQL
jgi:hypothetical protein